MNLTENDIKSRNLTGGETVVKAEYRNVKLPRGYKGRAIYVLLAGERRMRSTNLLEVNGQDVWADSLLTKFSPHDLNAAEYKAYSLAN